MTNFAYKALDGRGAQAAGEIEGESKAAVAAALRSRGLTVLDLNEVKQGWGQIQIGGRIKSKDLTVFSRQFATMVNSGLSMLRCLYVLEEQTPNKKFAAVIGEIRADVEAGIALSDALEKHPKVFSRLYVSMVRAGELGGILDEVLNRLATQLEKEDSIRRAVKSAMVYPVLIGSFAVIVLIGMVLFLIPIFAGMYKDLGNAQLPFLTRIMMSISNAALNFPWNILILAAIIAGIYGLIRLKRTDRGHRAWDRFKLRVPMGIGQIIRKLAIARFSRTLGTLITSGVPILQAIEITGQAAGNVVIEDAMVERAAERQGGPVDHPAPREGLRVPRHGHADDLRGRGDRLAGRHAGQDRRLLRGRGQRGGQVAHVHPRADPHAVRRRAGGHRGHLDVPADLQHDEHRQVTRGTTT